MQIEILNMAEINPTTKEQGLEFRKMKKDEVAVYTLLCPQKETYSPEAIAKMIDVPVRIKELVEMTKDKFYSFEIWEAESAAIKDPIILGRQKTFNKEGVEQNSYYDEKFFLGRWGEELENMHALRQKAKHILTKTYKLTLLKYKAAVEAMLSDVDLFVDQALDKGSVEPPSLTHYNMSHW